MKFSIQAPSYASAPFLLEREGVQFYVSRYLAALAYGQHSYVQQLKLREVTCHILYFISVLLRQLIRSDVRAALGHVGCFSMVSVYLYTGRTDATQFPVAFFSSTR